MLWFGRLANELNLAICVRDPSDEVIYIWRATALATASPNAPSIEWYNAAALPSPECPGAGQRYGAARQVRLTLGQTIHWGFAEKVVDVTTMVLCCCGVQPGTLSTALEDWSVSAVKSEHFSTLRK